MLTRRLPGGVLLLPVLAAEYVLFSLLPHQWFTIHLYRGGPIVFGLALLFFGRSALRPVVQHRVAFNRGYIAVHVLAFVVAVDLQIHLEPFQQNPRLAFPFWLEGLWSASLIAVFASLLLAFIPWRTLVRTAVHLRWAWLYAAICCSVVTFARTLLARTWDTPSRLGGFLQHASFLQTRALLQWLGFTPVALPASHILGTSRFVVQIASSCSGIEGLALVSAVLLMWLIVERRQLRILRVLLLLPAALCLMWVLNLLRLVVLIAIGNSGHPDIAINGFHSQAGWIFFNVVSFSLLLAVQRFSWFQKGQGIRHDRALLKEHSRNAAAIYLAPFLAIVGASLLSRLVSGTFEWFYPLRLVAALVALWWLRAEYRSIDWRFSSLGVGAGLGIAAVWLILYEWMARRATVPPQANLGALLSRVGPVSRSIWIGLHAVASVVTVPVAEELAFRGYLARRLMDPDVEKVRYVQLTWSALAGSALVFGVLHQQMWLAGIVAGIVFGLVARQRGRLGEAWAAHATANLALTVVVLVHGDFGLWS